MMEGEKEMLDQKAMRDHQANLLVKEQMLVKLVRHPKLMEEQLKPPKKQLPQPKKLLLLLVAPPTQPLGLVKLHLVGLKLVKSLKI